MVDKPAGMPVHPAADHGPESLTEWIRRKHAEDVSPIHRLDAATSGVVLLSSSSSERARWSHRFSTGNIRKTYIAMVHGRPPNAGELAEPLYDRRRRSLLPAHTYYETGICFWDTAQLICQPLTGRKHQIRRHLANIEHPIIGDPRYGISYTQRASIGSVLHAEDVAADVCASLSIRPRLWLHALRLETDTQCYESAVPEAFELFVDVLASRDEQIAD